MSQLQKQPEETSKKLGENARMLLEREIQTASRMEDWYGEVKICLVIKRGLIAEVRHEKLQTLK